MITGIIDAYIVNFTLQARIALSQDMVDVARPTNNPESVKAPVEPTHPVNMS